MPCLSGKSKSRWNMMSNRMSSRKERNIEKLINDRLKNRKRSSFAKCL